MSVSTASGGWGNCCPTVRSSAIKGGCEWIQLVHAFIIEDDYLISQSLQDLLERLGYTRFSFARSEDAATLGASGHHIDLITADVRLLPGDGLTAVEEICSRRQVPVVFITGYADELVDRAPDAIVVQKPIKESELRAAVRLAMARSEERC